MTVLTIDTDITIEASAIVDPWAAARCRDGHGTLTRLFFSDDVRDIARAKAICAKCPLQITCLEQALERAEPWGVWGGELLDGGQVVLTKRPRGRPPKHGHAPLLVDEDGNDLPREPRVA
jgi:WhiB family redox-sensing transcriptional regulator